MSEMTIHCLNLGETMDVSDFLGRVHGGDDFNWFSDSLSKSNAIHRKKQKTKKKLNAADRIQLKKVYNSFISNVQKCDPVLFRERISPSEIKTWFNHSVEVFRQISDDPKWTRTGTMLQYELWFLKAQLILMIHAVPVAMAFETDFFEVLVSVISKRRDASNNALSAEIAFMITFLVSHVVSTCLLKFEDDWKPEKLFKKLEATGILEQFFFCSAISQDKRADIASTQVVDQLLKCPAFVAKIFKKGTPCGDTARAILGSDHGPTAYRPVACRYLETLINLSWEIRPSDKIQACLCCKSSSSSKDFQSKLMQCSRCRVAYYCSKKCQTNDLKKHKKICKCLSKCLSESRPKTAEALIHVLDLFTQTNYVHIMKAFVMECDKSGIEKKYMVIEISFAPDSNGKIPALQDPPEFNIVSIKRYFDGSRLVESDEIFHCRDLATRQEIGSQILSSFMTHQNSSTWSPGLFYVCNHVDSFSLLPVGQQQSQLHSQEAVDAFRLAMNDNDFGPIANICRGDDKIMDLLRTQMGMPDDENIAPNAL